MRGFAILIMFNFAGLLMQYAGVPLPGNVAGLILFTACLFLGIIKLQWVENSAQFLLRHMLLFFAPVVVGAIAFGTVFKNEWLAVTIGLVGSWLVVLLVTGWCARWLVRHDSKNQRNDPS